MKHERKPIYLDQIAEILKEKGMIEQPVPAPTYHPRTFHEELSIWRIRLFRVIPATGALLSNAALYSLAPTFYRPENFYYIGAMAAAGAMVGALMAEGLAYYFADRDSQ